MKPSQETMVVAATECLAGMSQRDLARQLVDTAAERLELERRLDERVDDIMRLSREIEAAKAALNTVFPVIGSNDLLTLCECVRTEINRLRERPPF